MACAECAKLLAMYEELGRAYTAAIHNLTTKAGVSSKGQYTEMRIAVEDARLAWEISRMDMLKHNLIHELAN